MNSRIHHEVEVISFDNKARVIKKIMFIDAVLISRIRNMRNANFSSRQNFIKSLRPIHGQIDVTMFQYIKLKFQALIEFV